MEELEVKRLKQIVSSIKRIEGYESLKRVGKSHKVFMSENGDFVLINETGEQNTKHEDFNFAEIPGGDSIWKKIIEHPIGHYYVVPHIDDTLIFYKADVKFLIENRAKNPWAKTESKSRGGQRRYYIGINFKDAIDGKETIGIRAGGPGRPWLFDATKVFTEKFAFNENEDDLEFISKIREGKKIKVYSTKYERDSRIRKLVLKERGYTCCVCGINFEEKYGVIGKEYIHVHHNKPLYEGERKGFNIEDFNVVCPNCHAMLHRGGMLTVDELKEMMNNKSDS